MVNALFVNFLKSYNSRMLQLKTLQNINILVKNLSMPFLSRVISIVFFSLCY